MAEDFLKNLPEEVKSLVAQPENKNALIGAALGYFLTSQESVKNRNAVIGGLLGYVLTSGEKKDGSK